MSQKKFVLVGWVSVNNQAKPYLTALESTDFPVNQLTAVYLCWRDTGESETTKEKQALEETKKALQNIDVPSSQIHEKAWKTKSSPTDHPEIKKFVERTLLQIRQKHPSETIAVHLSPGTPAMHAVWLVLGSTGLIEGEVVMFQTTDSKGQAEGHPSLKIIDLSLNTWLHNYRTAQPQRQTTEDHGHLWNPIEIRSQALLETLEQLEEWAPLFVPVLLLGERGTGKTTLANLLRAKSPYQNPDQKTWPSVVCGQFRATPQLARAELFGYAKGAFTGATEDHKGLLEYADKDSLFLDEIADLDRDTQRLLMAALEGRGFQRLGETKLRQSRFRLICATNRSFEELQGGIIDFDFLDRIAVFVLHVPPLRDCKEDLPNAWRNVLSTGQKHSGIEAKGWEEYLNCPPLLKAIQTHPLPSNFRDLQRASYHLLAALHKKRPQEEILKRTIQALGADETHHSPLLPSQETVARALPLNMDDLLAEYSSLLLCTAEEKANGNISKAAELLKVSRKTFSNRRKSSKKE